MPLDPGSRLGRIRIDALLGVGGMGSVYRGFDERLERPVAIKEIHAEKRTAAVRARFLREARALSKLDHPNICRIYDVVERVDGDYLILELIDGRTLREAMNEGLSRQEVLRVAAQVAHVLAVTHGQGIVHRDLKPDNIMLTTAGEVKVLDFGLARFADETAPQLAPRDEPEPFDAYEVEKTAVLGRPTSTTDPDDQRTFAGSLVGTLTYMSPEQARGLPVDSASDIYSLGVVLFEVLSGGTRPYGEPDSLNDILRRVRLAEITWRDFGTRGLNALLHRMLALRASERPTAGEVRAALDAELARPATIRRRWMAAASIAVLLLLAAGGVLAARAIAESRRILNAERRGRLAFLPFRNETGDAGVQWVELGLTQLVAGGVSHVRGVRVVPVEEVSDAMRDLRIARNAKLGDAQRERLLNVLGADALVESAVTADGSGKYTIRFAPAARDRVDRPREVASTVLTEAANQMVRELAVMLDPTAPPADLKKHYSSDAFANTAYAIGEQEVIVHGPIRAVKYYEVAVDRDPGFAAAKLELAQMRMSLGNAQDAMRLVSEVVEQARRRGDTRVHTFALVKLADFHSDVSDFTNAGRLAGEALQMAQRLADAELEMNARNSIGYIAWRTNQPDAAEREFHAVMALAEKLRDVHAQLRTLNNIALMAEENGRFAEAARIYQKALALANRRNDREASATLIGNIAGLRVSEGKIAEAEPLYRQYLAMARELGDRRSEIMALSNLSIIVYSGGREEEAIALAAQAADVAKAASDFRVQAMARSNVAYASTRRGELDAAEHSLDEAIALIPRLGQDVESISEVLIAQVYWLIRKGRLAEAERILERDERQFRVSVRGLRMRARIAYARGDYAEAARIVERAKAMGDQWLAQDENMRAAFLESARTGRPATVEFELPVKPSPPSS